MKISTWFENEHDVEVEAVLEYSYSPYRPAVTSGPIEVCHPAEGGVEVERLLIDGEVVDENEYPALVERLVIEAEEYGIDEIY